MFKIKLLLTILVTIGISTLSAQWEKINLPFSCQKLNDVCAIDGVVYAVGDSGVVIKSVDNGNSWQKLNTNSINTIYSIEFYNSLSGFLGLDGEGILKTNDGGITWNRPYYVDEHPGNVHDIVLFSADSLIIGGNYSGLHESCDGGVTWQEMPKISTNDIEIEQLDFVTRKIGWAKVIEFENGHGIDRLYKTTDGGQTWSIITSTIPLLTDIYAVNFTDSLNGYVQGYKYVAGAYFNKLKTTDGGITWSRIPPNTKLSDANNSDNESEKLSSVKDFIYTISKDTVFFGSGGGLSKTADGGNSFLNISFDIAKQNGYLSAIDFEGSQNGYLVGTSSFTDGRKGFLYKTTNGGGVGIEPEVNNQPKAIQLLQNYPNPFNNSTVISYQLANAGLVKLSVYNAKGEIVQNLVNTSQSAGTHNIQFKANGLNSGVYFYKLETAGKSMIGKMLMVK